MTLWSGRVREGLAPEVWAFLRADDAELLPYDVEATRIHAKRLHAAGLLDDDELADAEQRLSEISAADVLPSDEDVHTAIERLVGPVGRRIHAGRSRNDQVAAALRLYVEDACDEAGRAIRGLAADILGRADDEAEAPMPAYTHLQRAQPSTVGHHLLAWVEMLERDLERFRLAADAAHPSPLGSGAAAGSTLPRRRPSSSGTPSTPSETGTSRSTTSTRARSCTATCRGSGKSSASGRRPSSASSTCPKRRRPDRRCCRRS